MTQLNPTFSFIHFNVSPYVLMVVILSAALLNPKIEQINIFQALVPYVFLISLLAWMGLTGAWFTYLVIKKKWLLIIKNTVFEYVRWAWIELRELRRSYLVKTGTGVVVSTCVLLSVQWFYYHFDLWRLLSTIGTFLKNAWLSLFEVHKLLILVHEWTNNAVIRWLNGALQFAQNVVKDHPIMGILLIALLVIGVVIFVSIVKCIKGEMGHNGAGVRVRHEHRAPNAAPVNNGSDDDDDDGDEEDDDDDERLRQGMSVSLSSSGSRLKSIRRTPKK